MNKTIYKRTKMSYNGSTLLRPIGQDEMVKSLKLPFRSDLSSRNQVSLAFKLLVLDIL